MFRVCLPAVALCLVAPASQAQSESSSNSAAPTPETPASSATPSQIPEHTPDFFNRLAAAYPDDWFPAPVTTPTVLFRPEIRLEHSYDVAAYDLGTKKTQFVVAGDLTHHI